jgi:hypothetical protein
MFHFSVLSFAGDFSLDIFPVMLDDDARYQCQVSPGITGEPGIRSKFATLTVLVPPEPPRIVQGDFLVTTEDREIELECVSLAGKPAAEVRTIARGLGSLHQWRHPVVHGLLLALDPFLGSTCRLYNT